jgi:hypothetical protein
MKGAALLSDRRLRLSCVWKARRVSERMIYAGQTNGNRKSERAVPALKERGAAHLPRTLHPLRLGPLLTARMVGCEGLADSSTAISAPRSSAAVAILDNVPASQLFNLRQQMPAFSYCALRRFDCFARVGKRPPQMGEISLTCSGLALPDCEIVHECHSG